MTSVEICNAALSRCGARRIVSLDESSEEARTCSLHYGPVRDALLRSHRWNFAKARQELARLADAPAFGWDFQYQLPSDWLRTLEFNGSETNDEQADDYDIEGDKLLTDAETAEMVYIRRIEDEGLQDSLFNQALILRLGAAISRKITGSDGLGASLLEEAEKLAGPKARQVDANEPRARKRPWPMDSSFVTSRFQ